MSETPSIAKQLRLLAPYLSAKDRVRFWGLLCLSVLMALCELGITGLVALLAAAFSSPEAVMQVSVVRWLVSGEVTGLLGDTRLLILFLLGAILCAIVAKNALTLVHQWALSTFAEGAGNSLRGRLLELFLRAPYPWVQNRGTADMLFALGASTLLGGLFIMFINIFSNLLMAVTIMSGLLIASPLPSLVFFTLLCVGALAVIRFSRREIDARSQRAFGAQSQLHKLEQKSVHGLKELRLYGREPWLLFAYASSLNSFLEARKRQQFFMKLPSVGLEVLGFATLLIVFLFLLFIQDASMARISGIMGFLAAAAWRCLPIGNRLVDNFSGMRANLPYLHKVLSVLEEGKTLAHSLLPLEDRNRVPITFTRELDVRDISYRYEGAERDAISNATFTLTPGEMLGLVGLSGGGKSTLVNLLTGLLSPARGQITIDGVVLNRDSLRSWLDRIGYVSQSPYILDASLAENIALSRYGENIDEGRVLECCKLAALDFVDDLADGIYTVLGERGARLSGGQSQRVAIARALYSAPELIIFDEATSALDIKNEKAVLETILSLRDKVTMVIIAHRLSTVESCDRIIWLENGRIHRTGSVNEVLPQYMARLEEAGSDHV